MAGETETVLDHTYLRPGIVTRAGAVGLAAVGIGAGALLACYGASFLFNTNNKRLNDLTEQVEKIVQRPDRSDEVIARLNDLKRDANKISGDVTTHLGLIEKSLEEIKHMPILDSNIATRLASIESSLEELKHRSIIPGNLDRHEETAKGNVIEREVTVFHVVPHDNGVVDTGWVYPDGSSADQRPTSQYCYWMSSNLTGTATRIDIATNGVQVPNIGAIPDLEEALQKCVWWTGSIN